MKIEPLKTYPAELEKLESGVATDNTVDAHTKLQDIRKRPRIYQCPIHGAIQFPGQKRFKDCTLGLDDLMFKLINTAEFQRLRHIRQNGVTNYAFHGAEHSRFAHSIGVAHVARRMFDRICLNSGYTVDDEVGALKPFVVAAALLHDVGHGPFSHTIEEIVNRGQAQNQKDKFSHEDITVKLITSKRLGGKLNTIYDTLVRFHPEAPNRIAAYINKDLRTKGLIPEQGEWTYQLVSSQLDADRLDYVLRDAHMCGLTETRYDLDRILNNLFVHPEYRNSISVSRHAVEAVESYLLAIDQLYRGVYYHQAVRSATVILKKVFERASDLIKDKQDPFPKRGKYEHPMSRLLVDKKNVPLETYVRLSDDLLWSLIEEWQDHDDPVLSDLSRRLWRRELFKTIKINSESGATKAIKKIAEEQANSTLGLLKDRPSWTHYYIEIDRSWRKTYKSEQAIWFHEKGHPAKLDDEKSSRIIEVVRNLQEIEFLMYPHEIHSVMGEYE
jgi:uncharacterized protein